MVYLEKELRKAVTEGQPRTHRPWRKIFLLVEGIYRFVLFFGYTHPITGVGNFSNKKYLFRH